MDRRGSVVVNRLAKESSAYLRSAAHQPVDWYPWGEEAFARARAEDKPILLDIGAVWCHWCHVIDRESYEDSKLAQLINERFIPVKVDRDERPDVDTRYQAAVNALAGQGGWPLTAFLTPNGKVFYGGTYFPPKDGMGRPSFRRVLEAVSDHYGNERKQAIADAENLHAALSTMPSVAAFEGEINDALLREVLDRVRGQFDLVNGGFGTTPKFPHPGTVEWLLARFHRTRDRAIGNLIAGTLTGMANGGIRDHVGGGFHRYSTDAQWIVPHFEKMAYDNAYLLLNFVHGWQVFRDPLLRETAKDVLRFVDGVLSDRDRGGFYASQDADVGLDDDGDFFTWTLDEVKGIVSDDELRVLQLRYDLYEKGEMRHNPKKNVLYGDKTSEEIASVLGLPLKTVDGQIASGLRKLRDARSKRPAPFVDTTIYANWNGMMIKAYFEAGSALRLPDVTAFARTSLDFVLREMVDPTVGVRHAWKDGKRGVAGLLDDHVEIADACLAAYEATGVLSYLETATAIADFVLERFWDAKEGGFFDTASGLAPTDGVAALEVRRKPIEDSPSPSANGVAAQVLMKLFHLTGRNVYRDRVDALIRAFAGTASRYGGIFAGAYFHAAELWLHPPAQVVIIGSPDDERTRRLRAAAVSTFSPGRTVALAEDSAHVPRAAETAVRSRKPTDPPAAFVCRGNVCFPPTDSPTKLVELLGMRSGA